jgi:hypothetical protein
MTKYSPTPRVGEMRYETQGREADPAADDRDDLQKRCKRVVDLMGCVNTNRRGTSADLEVFRAGATNR